MSRVAAVAILLQPSVNGLLARYFKREFLNNRYPRCFNGLELEDTAKFTFAGWKGQGHWRLLPRYAAGSNIAIALFATNVYTQVVWMFFGYIYFIFVRL